MRGGGMRRDEVPKLLRGLGCNVFGILKLNNQQWNSLLFFFQDGDGSGGCRLPNVPLARGLAQLVERLIHTATDVREAGDKDRRLVRGRQDHLLVVVAVDLVQSVHNMARVYHRLAVLVDLA